MSALLVPYLTIVAFVLGPVLLGVILGRAGVPKSAAQKLFNVSFYGCQTVLNVLTLWIARLDRSAALLPLLALSGWMLSVALSVLVSRALRHPPQRRGAFVVALSLSNNGSTLLGLVALSLFGEAGLAQASYTQSLYSPFFLLVCFPLARLYGKAEGGPRSLKSVLAENATDVRVVLPLTTMGIGLLLNLTGVERPAEWSVVVRPTIYVATVCSGAAVGLLFNGALLSRYWRENLISAVYRSTLYPLYYAGLALLFGLSGLDRRVLILFGLVPSALLANLLAVFFELDTDLTSSVFVVSTATFLVGVLPLYAWFTAFG